MVDLNIDNYELYDILHLFKIPADFNETDLKRAKQIVLKTHPDKSKLSPEYFRFYSKAYKILYNIWEFRKLGDVDNTNKNTDYISEDAGECDGDEEKKIILDAFFEKNGKFKNSKEFNGWFNDQFERNKEKDAMGRGYGEWFKNEEDAGNDGIGVTMATMSQEFEKKKMVARSKSLVEYRGIQELYSASSYACELSEDTNNSFSSDLFSNLAYQDLHQAHTQTVIPVTDEDFTNKQKFNNVNEFMSHRNSQDTKPLSEQQALQYLNNRTKKDDEIAVSRAYQLAKQTELAKQKNQEFWAGIKLIQ
jgi:hypothetical protein